MNRSRKPNSNTTLARWRGLGIHDNLIPWRKRLASNDPVARIIATSAEYCHRYLGLQPFEGQLIAALAMHECRLAQMQTGEGKTLAAALAVIPRALAGQKVHLMTANDYLAKRDAAWMEPVYAAWNLHATAISSCSTTTDRRRAYQSDIIYLSAREAGFDFLRDGLAIRPEDRVQGALDFALVDEADYILIDEARIPMVIAGDDPDPVPDLERIQAVAEILVPGTELDLDSRGQRVTLSHRGQSRAATLLGLDGLHNIAEEQLWARLHAALHARLLIRRDIDYIVREGKIELVDECTGRVAERRRLPWGVQAALEMREGLTVQAEGRIQASITTRHFISRYQNLAAMTATACPQAADFHGLYGLKILIIPPARPLIRYDMPDRVFRTAHEKRQALIQEIAKRHQSGQPVLVGTASVQESVELAAELQARKLPCVVLNASQDRREAELISRAGSLGAITIATNMAGRGTDIALAADQREHLLSLGGLCVLGSKRHESQRIDDQLRGRAGRQGDPGTSQFFVSLEDPLFVRYGVPAFLPHNAPLDDPRVLAEIDRAQGLIAAQNSKIRNVLQQYSMLLEKDRHYLAEIRRAALEHGVLPNSLAELRMAPVAPALLVQIFLANLDRFWSDHLLRAEDIREGISLVRFGSRDPWLNVQEKTITDWQSLSFDQQNLGREEAIASLGSLGIHRPSSTWNYLSGEEATPAFNLAMLATTNMAIASLTAIPLLLLQLFGRITSKERGK